MSRAEKKLPLSLLFDTSLMNTECPTQDVWVKVEPSAANRSNQGTGTKKCVSFRSLTQFLTSEPVTHIFVLPPFEYWIHLIFAWQILDGPISCNTWTDESKSRQNHINEIWSNSWKMCGRLPVCVFCQLNLWKGSEKVFFLRTLSKTVGGWG